MSGCGKFLNISGIGLGIFHCNGHMPDNLVVWEWGRGMRAVNSQIESWWES